MSNLRTSNSRQVSQVEVEGSTPQYEGTLDDYLEMFIQFGYVTLFRYSTAQYSTVQYSTVQYSTVQHGKNFMLYTRSSTA